MPKQLRYKLLEITNSNRKDFGLYGKILVYFFRGRSSIKCTLICSTKELDLSYNPSTDQTAEVSFQMYVV